MELAVILENLPVPVLVLDMLKTEILFVNTEFCLLIDFPAKELTGKPESIIEAFIMQQNGASILEKIHELGDFDGEPVNIRCGNVLKNMTCRCRVMIKDNFVYSICVFETINDNNGLPGSSRGFVFSESESHSIRSWVSKITALVQVLGESDSADSRRSTIDDIQKSCTDIIAVFTPPESGKHNEPDEKNITADDTVKIPGFDMVALIKLCINAHLNRIKEKKIHLKLVTQHKAIRIINEEDIISQAIDVFIREAVNRTDSGEISIELFFKYQEEKQFLVTRVNDTGIGIKRSFLDLLAGISKNRQIPDIASDEQFYTDLSKAKWQLEECGAQVFIESQYGVGTSVSISLPYSEVNLTEASKSRTDSGKHKSGLTEEQSSILPTVLIVDDDQMVFQIIKKFLDGRCSTDYAVDGRRALLAAAARHYDIIFLDINLGVGLTGLQVAKKLRLQPEYMKTPMVAITAYAMPGDKERALMAGCTLYQSKPFSRADIVSLYNECLKLIEQHG